MPRVSFCLTVTASAGLAMLLLPSPLGADEPGESVPFYRDKQNLLYRQDPAGTLHPIRTPAEWELRRDHILAAMQLVMGPLPADDRRVPLNPRLSQPIERDGYTQQHVTFAVEAEDRVPGWLLLPTERRGPAPAMLCLHQTTAIGKDEPIGQGGLANLHYAAELARRGYVTLAVDYPNFGEYQLDPYARGYASATMKGIWNHARAVDFLTSLPEVDRTRIGVIGHSLGGHNSLFAAAFDSRLRCIVSSCGFCSFDRYYGGDLTGWSHRGYMPRIAEHYDRDPARMPFDFTEVVAALAPRPFLAVAPTGDSNFDVGGVKQCFAAARPVYDLFDAGDRLVADFPDAGHDFPLESRRRVYAWIDRWLGDAPYDSP